MFGNTYKMLTLPGGWNTLHEQGFGLEHKEHHGIVAFQIRLTDKESSVI